MTQHADMPGKMLDTAIRESLFQALLGWLYWGRIVRKYDMKRTLCVLLPVNEPETSFYAIKLLDKAVQIREFEKSLVITTDCNIKDAIKSMSTSVIDIVVCSDKIRKQLLQYSMYTGIDARFINASLDEPSARICRQLVGFRNITRESLVAYGIYGIAGHELHDKDEKEYRQFLRLVNGSDEGGLSN